MPDILRLIGGAGTGKTSRLMQEIDRALGLYGIEQFGFSTMTRAARSVAVGRAVGAGKLEVSGHGGEYFKWDLKPRSYGASLISSLGGGSATGAKIDRLAVQLDRVAEAVGLPQKTPALRRPTIYSVR